MKRRIRIAVSGVVAIGPYVPGVDYVVEEPEASRLVGAKGFVDAPEMPAVDVAVEQ